mmetsp:Transcript_5553/g.12214  ORF Transcript_5553/g.12214 Transcript_5553/m.12214 type:complete len:106 (-) Transcript_5553:306-623(-)
MFTTKSLLPGGTEESSCGYLLIWSDLEDMDYNFDRGTQDVDCCSANKYYPGRLPVSLEAFQYQCHPEVASDDRPKPIEETLDGKKDPMVARAHVLGGEYKQNGLP